VAPDGRGAEIWEENCRDRKCRSDRISEMCRLLYGDCINVVYINVPPV